jgi:hypothetical protein
MIGSPGDMGAVKSLTISYVLSKILVTLQILWF